MKQTQRPAQIAAILKTMEPETRASLEAYISGLENRKRVVRPGKKASPGDPSWSHQRTAKLEQQGRKRASRERTHDQSVTEPYLRIVEKR